jgi:hypothetical protein
MKKIFTFIILLTLLSVSFVNSQTTIQRKVFFEGFTSSTCGPCASANPYMAAYLATKGDSIVSVKYHMGWPSPGNDPMYLYNTVQAYDRRYVYGVNSIPYTRFDGLYYTQTYSNPATLNYYFWTRLAVPTPVQLTVVDQRLPGDSIQATVTVTNLSALTAGTYYLRVMALELNVRYATPLYNGESIFPHVFRKSYPNSTGTALSTAAGTYTFVFKYKIDVTTWDANNIYTVAFVQEDATKEIFNVAGKWTDPSAINPISSEVPVNYSLGQNYPNPFNPRTTVEFSIPKSGFTSLKVYNILGKEVGTYVNENVKAGSYFVTVDGANLASGVYFYTLTSGDFSQTKRMTLLK